MVGWRTSSGSILGDARFELPRGAAPFVTSKPPLRVGHGHRNPRGHEVHAQVLADLIQAKCPLP
jgi:hypothetical protein